MKILSIAFTALALMASISMAVEDLPKQLEPGAVSSLYVFKAIVTARDNYREMGFKSPAELDRMALGVPIKVYQVRLDRLQGYRSEMAPEGLFEDNEQYLYPVVVDAQTRSSLTMSMVQGNWQAVSYGSPRLVQMIDEARSAISSGTDVSIPSMFLIEIPALNTHLIGYKTGTTTMAAPLMPNGSRISPRPAADVLMDLVPMAKAHDGLPR